MYFIGCGAPLYQSVSFARKAGYAIDGVCVPHGHAISKRLSRLGSTVLESNSPENTLPNIFAKLGCKTVFSINNNYLLPDSLLQSGPLFFNLHNGLVQNYRGIAEICLFAALCRGEREYGATLHQLLPGQMVDSGPAVSQLRFELSAGETFAVAIKRSLDNCQALFEQSLASIIDRSMVPKVIDVASKAYTYRDVPCIVASADPLRLANASTLGMYAGLFPRLRQSIAPILANQDFSTCQT